MKLRQLVLIAIGCLGAGTPSRAMWSGYAKSPESIPVLSPQLGSVIGSKGGVFAGITASNYWDMGRMKYLGGGVGAYTEDGKTVGELFIKGSFLGGVGAGFGPSWSDEGMSIANDVWFSYFFVGGRWRMDHRPSGTVHALTVFVPLWWMFLR